MESASQQALASMASLAGLAESSNTGWLQAQAQVQQLQERLAALVCTCLEVPMLHCLT